MVKMKKVITALKRSRSADRATSASQHPASTSSNPTSPSPAAYVVDDTPEANIRRAITKFCESGGASGSQAGDEVLYLPPIVEAAECSPAAAKEASVIIRKFLDMKNDSKPYSQYNAIMIMRILADNPGKTFTRNLDSKFADKVKELLKHGRDQSVKQLLIETLEHFEVTKKEDEGLSLLREVWAKQKAVMTARYQPPPMVNQRPRHPLPPPQGQQQSPSPRGFAGTSLPPLEELVGRISEAQTSAKLLHQVLSSTPRNEILKNDLVKEFVHRCKLASRSMQDLITCDNPPPDQDTLQTLIETNDILRIALSRYQAIKDAHEMGRDQNQTDTTGQSSLMHGGGTAYAHLQNSFRDSNQDIPPLSLDRLSLIDNQPGPARRSPPPPAVPPKIDTGNGRSHSRKDSDVSSVSPQSARFPSQTTYRY